MALADMVARSAKSPESMNFLSDDIFGHMTHEWQCREVRAGMDYEDPGAWHEYEVRERDAVTVFVTFPDGFNPDFRLIFEGSCYKVFSEDHKHYEYFCPVE
jgi:hypothetical protein